MYVCASVMVGITGCDRHCGGIIAFLIAIFTSPIIGLIVVAISPLKKERK